jgi:quinol monooxygenase YgiN
MILVTGCIVAKEDRLAEALSLSLEHVRRSRLENGCIAHAVHQDAENPRRLVFFEEWVDQAALAAHFTVPASRDFTKAVAALAVQAPKLSVFEARELIADAI